MLRGKSSSVAIVAAVAGYTCFIRTRGIAGHFLLLGDQIRDWSIALRPFADLPLAGPPRVDGGVSLGPIFYWTLWAARVTVGPFVQNLPHAGGIGLAVAESIGDAVLLVGLRKATHSWAFAIATVLIVASSPFDLALAAAIWNPVLAVALAKITMGLIFFWHDALTTGRRVTIMAVAWLTAQAHTPGVAFAAGVLVWMASGEFRRSRRSGVAAVLDIVAVIVILQIPFLLGGGDGGPTGLWSSLTNPGRLRIVESFNSVFGSLGFLTLDPWSLRGFRFVLLAASLLLAAIGPLAPVIGAAIAPLGAAVLAFAFWQGPYDFYWYMTFVPCAVVCLAWLVHLSPAGRARTALTAAFLLAAVIVQPSRVRAAPVSFRMPEYASLVRASRTLVRGHEPIKRIEAPFLPPTGDAEFIFRILGGRIDRDAAAVAVVSRTGDVTYHR